MVHNHNAISRIGGDDFAAQVIDRDTGLGRSRCSGILTRVAPGQQNNSQRGGNKNLANHRPVYNRGSEHKEPAPRGTQPLPLPFNID